MTIIKVLQALSSSDLSRSAGRVLPVDAPISLARLSLAAFCVVVHTGELARWETAGPVLSIIWFSIA